MRNKDSRRLTADEIAAVPAPFAATLDLNRVEIHRRRWTVLTPRSITVARGYRIYWPSAPDEARSPQELAHLIHEMVHVWQYNVLGIGMYSLRWLDRRYNYELRSGSDFLSFGLEQQASIIEDAYFVSLGYEARRARNTPNPQAYSDILEQTSSL